jgi:hypothetical protein
MAIGRKYERDVDLLLGEGFDVSLSVQEGNNLPGCRALVRGRWWVGVGPEPKMVVAARTVATKCGIPGMASRNSAVLTGRTRLPTQN